VLAILQSRRWARSTAVMAGRRRRRRGAVALYVFRAESSESHGRLPPALHRVAVFDLPSYTTKSPTLGSLG
jgi:hypothetical protein